MSLGEDVTLHCQSHYGFDQFALHKEGDTAPYKGPERWYRADFPILTVMAAHSGTYRCYGFFSSRPYLWSPPSDPLELVVTGKGLQTTLPSSFLPGPRGEGPAGRKEAKAGEAQGFAECVCFPVLL